MNIPIITPNALNEISRESGPVVVEFFADWCPKCAMMSDIFLRIAARHQHDIIFKKVNIEISKKVVDELGIEIVPTFIVYQKGKILMEMPNKALQEQLSYDGAELSEDVLEQRILELLYPNKTGY